jgi:alkaline phosphatase/alkaline phosphatase D
MKCVFFLALSLCLLSGRAIASHFSYEMAGEMTESSVILQSRLANPENGISGKGRFEISETPDFKDSIKTEFQEARSEHDFIVKDKITDLKPNTSYYYRVIWTLNDHSFFSPIHVFKTLAGAFQDQEVHFVVTGEMNYAYFQRGRYWLNWLSAYYDHDKRLGYRGLEAVSRLNPDFVIFMGDNVYYDPFLSWPAKTQVQMRMKWHEQLSQERFVELFSKAPAYWLMDDHDFRFDNAHPGIKRDPAPELGTDVFLEQLPVLDFSARGGPAALFGGEDQKIFYRTHRITQALQIWILDNRTLRSSNDLPDGPEKTVWGREQLSWLKETLLQSDAPFKLIFSSTPIIGPDKLPTNDNHASGFRYEREAFLNWLKENHFEQKNLYFVAGDSHWKYHSKDPLGFEEFSIGPLDRSNAIRPAISGKRNTTDPKGEIIQHYVDPKLLGGFLRITVSSSTLEFSFYDSRGNRLHRATRAG